MADCRCASASMSRPGRSIRWSTACAARSPSPASTAGSAGARDHRDRGARRRRHGVRRTLEAVRALGVTDRARRFRHRLFEPEPSHATAARQGEDRQELHPATRQAAARPTCWSPISPASQSQLGMRVTFEGIETDRAARPRPRARRARGRPGLAVRQAGSVKRTRAHAGRSASGGRVGARRLYFLDFNRESAANSGSACASRHPGDAFGRLHLRPRRQGVGVVASGDVGPGRSPCARAWRWRRTGRFHIAGRTSAVRFPTRRRPGASPVHAERRRRKHRPARDRRAGLAAAVAAMAERAECGRALDVEDDRAAVTLTAQAPLGFRRFHFRSLSPQTKRAAQGRPSRSSAPAQQV